MEVAPETFTIECNRAISKNEYPNLNPDNNEWQTIINPPIQLRRNDQITISNIFLNERGASNDVISFNSDPKSRNQNNKTRIAFSFYAMNDGTCDKRNGLDILSSTRTDDYNEKNTYAFTPLFRRQKSAFDVNVSDPNVIYDPYRDLAFTGFTGILGANEVWVAYEDRYLPSLYHNKLTCNQFEGSSIDGAQSVHVYFNAQTEEICFHNPDNNIPSTFHGKTQPGAIYYIRTKGVAAVTAANTANIYLDNYYLCTNKNMTDLCFDANSNGSNLYVTANSQIVSNITSSTITFPNDPLFTTRIVAGLYISNDNEGTPYLSPNTTITSISSAAEIDRQETVIYNNTSLIGGNSVRVSDISTLQKHMVLNVDIPVGSLITDIKPDTFPSSVTGIQVIDSVLPGTNVLKVPISMSLVFSENMEIIDTTAPTTNYNNQNIPSGITSFALNQKQYMTKTTNLDSSAQQNLGADNFGYFPVPDINNLFIGKFIQKSIFIDDNTKIRKIVPFTAVTNLISKVSGSPISGVSYVDVATTGITLLDADDNEPALFNITSGTLTSRSFPGTANITHVDSQGSFIRVHIDKLLQTPVGNNTPENLVMNVPSTPPSQTGKNITLYGTIQNFSQYTNKYIWDGDPAAGHFGYATKILFIQTSSTPGYVQLTLSNSILNPITNNAAVATIGFVDEVTINQLNNSSHYILPDKPLLNGIGANQVIPFYTYDYDPQKDVYIGLVVQNSSIPVNSRITTVSNFNDGSRRQQITIDNTTIGAMGEFEEIIVQQRAFGNSSSFFVDTITTNTDGTFDLNLSNNLPFEMAEHSTVTIQKKFPNQGTVFMDNNFTSDLAENSIITFKLIDRNIIISSPILVSIPANTKFYFHHIPQSYVTGDTPGLYSWDFVQSQKGYQYNNSTDLGMRETDGVKVGDDLYNTIFTRAKVFQIANPTTNVNKRDSQFIPPNVRMNDKVSLRITDIDNTIIETLGISVNENTLLTGYLNNDLTATDTTITLRMPPTFDFDDTSELFNLQRGFVFKIIDINNNNVEYIRIQNGVNNPQATTATYIWSSPNLTLTEVMRGQLGTQPMDVLAQDAILTFFNQIPQKTKITNKIGVGFNQGKTDSQGDLFAIYDISYLWGTNTNTEFLNFVESVNLLIYNRVGNSKATNIFTNVPKNYQSFYQPVGYDLEVLHRDYLDIDLGGQTNLTPSDITERFNSIAQQPTDKRINYSAGALNNGVIIPGTATTSIPTNKTFFPIVGIPVKPQNGTQTNTYPGFSEITSAEESKVMGDFYFKCIYSNYQSFNAGLTVTESIIIPRNGLYPPQFYKDMLTLDPPTTPPVINYPQPLIDNLGEGDINCYYSQMMGCSDFSMNYNSNKNRFELKTHQVYTTYPGVGDTSGGQLATKIFYPYLRDFYGMIDQTKPVGMKFQDRFGGINMECWSSPILETGLNDPLSYINDPYDINNINDLNQVGRRFWNKLGFSNDQLMNSKGNTINSDGLQILNGTSGNKVDVSFSYVPNEISSNSLAFPSMVGSYVPYSKTSFGGFDIGILPNTTPQQLVEIGNHSVSYNLPSTIGIPFDDDFSPAVTTGGTTPVTTPASGTVNPDNTINPGYNIAFSGEIEGLTAVTLPVKTVNPYFLLFCKEFSGNNNFYTTFNKGSLQGEAMATISRLYSSMDFYYSYQSPQAFFLKNDITLSTITNKILNSDMTSPITIGENSSVIYQIIRQNPKPIPLPPTIQQQQEEYYQQQEEMEETARKIKSANGLVGVQNVINQITQAIVTPSDNENELINRILGNAESLNIGKMSPKQLKKEIASNPNMANILNDIQTLQGQTPQFGSPASPPPLDFTGNFYSPQFGTPYETPYETPGGITPEDNLSFAVNPDELRAALNQSKLEESLLQGNVEPIQTRIEGLGGRPKTLSFTPLELQGLTPTAELSRREQILQEPGTKIYGEGRKQLEKARLTLAQKISDKNQSLKGEDKIEQKLPEERDGGGAAPKP